MTFLQFFRGYLKKNNNVAPTILPYDDDNILQKGLIITDDIAIDPILDFNLYRDAIVKIIRDSYPKFTIGIFGDWGTGKTTLMNSIDKALENDKNLFIVRFETWRYEREEQFALIPLLKSIAFALPDDPILHDLKQKLKRGAINLLKKSPEIASSLVSTYLGDHSGEISEKAFDAEVDRDTLYFDGFEDIKNEIRKIHAERPGFRIIVSVDDLDRCSPKKTLEILESIKVFLGMESFIYIVGMSHDIVTKLIDIEYEKSGVKGEQYIKKMIQIPITLPKWDNQDIVKLVKDFVKKGIIHDDYKKVIDENIVLISTAIENNPREIKRFLNNFIVAYEIFSPSKDVKAQELFAIQAIQLRWGKFYDLLIKSDEKFRLELKKYVEMEDEKRLTILVSQDAKDDENYDTIIRKLLSNFKDEFELWSFLAKNFETLNNITNWGIYRRATEVTKVPEPIRRPKGTRGTIFLAYAKLDGLDLALNLIKYLVTEGYTVLDSENLLPKEHVIKGVDVMFVIVTPGALNSPAVADEVKEALRLEKTMVPILVNVENSDLKWGLEHFQGIEFSDFDELRRRVSYSLEALKLTTVSVT